MHALDQKAWTVLAERVQSGKCTVFLGAGISTVGRGAEIAERWATTFGYPAAGGGGDLAQVAQFMALSHGGDMVFPKDQMAKLVREATPPDFDHPDEPHRLLAKLPIPVYITTNYDGYMWDALDVEMRAPSRYLCAWNSVLKGDASVAKLPKSVVPTRANPIVFHLHGYHETEHSMVLTEDDYLDFLVAAARHKSLLPHQIIRALTASSLIFIGYRLADWDFRVLFRGLVTTMEGSLRRISVSVQLGDDIGEDEKRYMESYFGNMNVQVYWGNASAFARELHRQWSQVYG